MVRQAQHTGELSTANELANDMICAEKIQLKNEYGISYDEFDEDILVYTLHLVMTRIQNNQWQREHNLLFWLAPGEDPWKDEPALAAMFGPADLEDQSIDSQWQVPSHWEAT